MMHVIVTESLFDSQFIAQYTVGFEGLCEHLSSMTPQWAAEICGVDADHIERFARDYAATERAMLLLGGSSLYKDSNGWQASRAISCLPALTGKLGKAGAGLAPPYS